MSTSRAIANPANFKVINSASEPGSPVRQHATMFRRKKYGGEVTIVEDGDARGQLLDGASSAAQQQQQQQQQESAADLEAAALEAAMEGKAGTRRALKLATEARETGVETAAALHKQTQQLEKMGEEIEVVHDYLDKSERIIDKMSKPKIVRMFQRKKPVGKGLDKVRTGKKARGEREGMRDAGVGALDLGAMADGAGEEERNHMREAERDELLGGADKKRGGRFRKGKEKPATTVGARDIEEDYSQYTDGVAKVMREQDKDLDGIADAIGDMKMLAGAMNSELNYQNELIDEVQTYTEETRKRTKDHASRVERIK